VTVSGILPGFVDPLGSAFALARGAARIQPARPVPGLPGRRAGESSPTALSPTVSLSEARDVVELTGPHGEEQRTETRQTLVKELNRRPAAGLGHSGYSPACSRQTPHPTPQFIDALA
jgi:hypothetical protein